MATNKPKSLAQLLFSYEVSFLALIVVTAALGGVWVYFWQQTSREAFRINSLLYDAQKLRADLYRQVREVYDASRVQDPRALDRYWAHIYEIDRRFYALEGGVAGTDESRAVADMRNAYTMLQTELNQLLSRTVTGSGPDQIIQPAYESWLRGGFETAFDELRGTLNGRSRNLTERLGRFNNIAVWVFPVPFIVALMLLVLSRRKLRSEFARPMDSLRHGALEISRGHFDHRVAERGTKETATLAQAVNRMAADLAATRDALVEKEKQAAMGALVPVVAHNIRNPLASIRATAQMVERDDDALEFDNAKSTIIDTVDRLERWVAALLSYLNPLKPHSRPIEVGALIDNALKPLQTRLAERGLSVVRHEQHAETVVEVDVDLMEQALHGLLLNAIEAAPRDSRIEVTFNTADNGLEVLIDDQGPGMAFAPEPQDLTPGPTTKSSGTGLGIPFAHKVCRSHGARLEFLSAPEPPGTRVRIILLRTPASGS